MNLSSPSQRESFRVTAKELLDSALRIVDDHERRGDDLKPSTDERLTSLYARARALNAKAEGKPVEDAHQPGILYRTIRALVLGNGNRTVAAGIATRDNDPEVAMVIKAASDPATVGVAAWAGVFAATVAGELLEYVRPRSALFSLVPDPFPFGRAGTIVYPRHTTATPSGFVAEAAAIPVRAAAFDAVTLRLSKAAGIVVATGELIRRGDRFSETYVNDSLSEDVAAGADAVFLSDAAATPAAPAGIFHASNADAAIAPTAGGNGLAAATDIANLLAAGATMTKPMLVINTASAAAVSLLTGASDYALLTGLVGGRALNASVLYTPNIAATTVALIDTDGLLVSADGFELDVSVNAALHMEDAPAVDLNGATPVRSMYQTDSNAVRCVLPITWRSKRLSAVQRVENVTW